MDDRYLKQRRPASRRYRKRVLAVSAMAGETAWLDGSPIWREGRVIWETGPDQVIPDRPKIALAQRRLSQIGGYPRASRQALGDAPGWLARRFDRLDIAKRLSILREPDLAALCTPASIRQTDERGIRYLASLLPVEAYCLGGLSASPASALYSCGSRAIQPLLALLSDPEELPAARALAALVLGAINKVRTQPGVSNPAFTSPWEERAYGWGLRNGLPDPPSLYLMFLQENGGAELAGQFALLREQAGAYLLDTERLRKLLARGVTAAILVDLCKACAEFEPLAERIGRYRHELPARNSSWRAETASDLRKERAQRINELVALIQRFAFGAADPSIVRDALAVIRTIIYIRTPYHGALGEAADKVLHSALDLQIEAQGHFFQLLYERRDFIWIDLDHPQDIHLQSKLASIHRYDVEPLCYALTKVRDLDVVRMALKLDNVRLLTAYNFKDPEMLRFGLTLISELGAVNEQWAVMAALARINFASVKEAKQAISPLVSSILQAPDDSRDELLRYFLDELPTRPGEAHDKAHRWAPYISVMLPLLTGERAMPYTLVRMTIALDTAFGEPGVEWFRNLIGVLSREIPPDADATRQSSALRLTMPLAVALANSDYEVFQRIVLTGLSHSFDHDVAQLDRAAKVLSSFPILRSALARIFPLQPHRCMDLAVKISFVSQLGREAAAPLGYLEGSATEEIDLPGDWQAVLTAAPGVEESVRSYLLAQRLRGENEAVPPGVRKALEQPQRLAGELSYLERKLAEDPARADLRARADSLRARLVNDGKLMSEVSKEIEERLVQVGAEAHIACAEMKALECYRLRLQTLAGPLPPDLGMSDNLVNATLLIGDIDSNRKLLTRLLRAYVGGDRRWPEHHPGNVSFLTKLAEAGVNTVAWLSASPRKYVCKGVAGGKVRLMLERDPLGVLQMGNYFDTCLSFGQFNAFSTVANACELNKRVVYAYDTMGRVVGRKLIGINGEGKLIGFYTYSTLGDEEGKELRAIFRRYCTDFASKCGLELADSGTVPRLFAKAWYDDGAVPWSDAEDEQSPRRGGQSMREAIDEPELTAPISALP